MAKMEIELSGGFDPMTRFADPTVELSIWIQGRGNTTYTVQLEPITEIEHWAPGGFVVVENIDLTARCQGDPQCEGDMRAFLASPHRFRSRFQILVDTPGDGGGWEQSPVALGKL